MILGSTLISKVLIPFLMKQIFVFLDFSPQFCNLPAAKSLRESQLQGLEPKLSITLSLVNMNVRWLPSRLKKKKR
jgi:hypothetical protein